MKYVARTEVVNIADIVGDHAVAAANPMMTEVQYRSLKADIEKRGQQVEILLYRNKIVDGRNRVKALRELGQLTVKAGIIKHKTTEQELKEIVAMAETRRHQSDTQRAIGALTLVHTTNLKQAEAAQKMGVSLRNVELASAIYKIAPLLMHPLHMGEYYILSTGRKTVSLSAILHDLKGRQVNATKAEQVNTAGIVVLTPEQQMERFYEDQLLDMMMKSKSIHAAENAMARFTQYMANNPI